jgi:hypothetical protein
MAWITTGSPSIGSAKTDLTAIAVGATVTKWVQASDWNEVRTGLLAFNTWLRGGVANWYGLGVQTSDPAPASVGSYTYATSTDLKFKPTGASVVTVARAGEYPSRINDTAGSTTYYVDGVNGSDTNAGTSSITAFATIQGVLRAIAHEYTNGSRVTIKLAGTGGFDGSATSPRTYTIRGIRVGGGEGNLSYRFEGAHMVLATGLLATGSTQPTFAATASERCNQAGTTDASSRRCKLNFSGAGWTANDMRGKMLFVRVKRGADLVLFEAPISDNAANTIYLDIPIDNGDILSTDTCEIVQPSVKIIGDGGDNYDFVTITGHAGYSDLAGLGMGFTRINFTGPVLLAGFQGGSFDRCGFSGGLTARGGSTQVFNCKALGGVTWSTTGSDYPTPLVYSGTSPLEPTYGTNLICCTGGLFVGDITAGPGSFRVTHSLGCYTEPTYAGVTVGYNSYFVQANSVGVHGDSNATVGMHCTEGGKANIAGTVYNTITGTGGDLKCGTGAAVAYGTGAGQFEEVAGFNGNFHRMGGSTATVPLGDGSWIGKG